MDTHTRTTVVARLPAVAAVGVLVVVVDQLTKLWAGSTLAGREPVPVLGTFLRLRLIHNPGAAFSIGDDATWVFTILSAVAVAAILWYATQHSSWTRALTLGLLLGGAFTHLFDRLFRAPGFGRGQVVDFIDYNGWFIGNVADIALVLGAALLIGQSLVGTRVHPEPERAE